MRATLASTVAMVAMAAAGVAQAAQIGSVSRLAFGPAGADGTSTLFVADWAQSTVHALTLPPARPDAGQPFNVRDLDTPLRAALGTGDVTLEDISARPGSDEVYVAVTTGATKDVAIVAVRADGSVRKLDLGMLADTTAPLDNAPDAALTFWDNIPGRSFTVTDMKWHEGKLYLAGLSNQSFASSLRIIPYPFGHGAGIASVEMYHTSHNQMETRAPIRAMAFTELDGKPFLLAAYLCTPLVTIPLESLRDGAHVTGKTIAELGDAGTPADIVPYTAMNFATGKPEAYVLVANQFRESSIIPLSSVAEANRGPGFSKPVPFGQVVGVQRMGTVMSTVMRVDDQDAEFLVALRRDLPTGHAQLVSINKAATFRLSDYDVSEYLFPDYRYTAPMQANFIKPMQNMLKKSEGFADQVRPRNVHCPVGRRSRPAPRLHSQAWSDGYGERARRPSARRSTPTPIRSWPAIRA